MKRIILILPILFFSTPLNFFAAEKKPNVSFIYSEFFIQILCTIFLIFLIKKYAWKNFQEMINNRQKAINEDIESAQEARINAKTLEEQKSSELQELTTKKKDILATTISKAKEEEKNILAIAKTKSKDLLEKAQAEAIREKESVKDDLSKELASVSIELVKKFMFDELTEETEQRLIKQATSEVKND